MAIKMTKYLKLDIYSIEEVHVIMQDNGEKCPNCTDKICHFCAINKVQDNSYICDECYSKMDIQELEE